PLRLVTILSLFRLRRQGLWAGADRVHPEGVRLALLRFTNSFECAKFRGPFSWQRREVYFTGDQLRSFKFPFARQHSRVAPHIAEEKFYLARECYRFSFCEAPFCLRRIGGSPGF